MVSKKACGLQDFALEVRKSPHMERIVLRLCRRFARNVSVYFGLRVLVRTDFWRCAGEKGPVLAVTISRDLLSLGNSLVWSLLLWFLAGRAL